MMTAPDSARAHAITIRPVGGLGNQLFIYATGRAVADRLHCPLLVDPSNYAFPIASETPRELQLDWIVDADQVLAPTPPPRTSRITAAVQRRITALAPRGVFQESSFRYDPRIEQVPEGTTLRGYFQSWRYFESIGGPLRAEMLERAPSSSWRDRELTTLTDLGAWIGVHVRRGDYLIAANAQHHGVLGADYYRAALSQLAENHERPLVVFSDDPEAARALIEPIHPVAHTVTPPPESHPMESITLMAQASALAIANSSFSWWAAWLADPATSPVVAPSPWFSGVNNDERDLCPPQWVRLPSSRMP